MLPSQLSHSRGGRAHFLSVSSQTAAAEALVNSSIVPIRYVDNYLRTTEAYPANPNGSPGGIAGIYPSTPPYAAMRRENVRTLTLGL